MLADFSLVTTVEARHLEIEEVVSQIKLEIDALEPRRKYLFVEWLFSHCKLVHGMFLDQSLIEWLSTMDDAELDYQHRLILLESDWWKEQDDHTIARLFRDHFGERHS